MISQEFINEVKKSINKSTILVDLYLKNKELHLTTADITVYDYDNLIMYFPYYLKINDIQISSSNYVDSMKLSLDNTQYVFSDLFILNDQRRTKVKVKFAFLDDNFNIDVSVVLFSGILSGYTITDKTIDIEVKSILSIWNNKTQRIHSINLFPNIVDIYNGLELNWGKA